MMPQDNSIQVPDNRGTRQASGTFAAQPSLLDTHEYNAGTGNFDVRAAPGPDPAIAEGKTFADALLFDIPQLRQEADMYLRSKGDIASGQVAIDKIKTFTAQNKDFLLDSMRYKGKKRAGLKMAAMAESLVSGGYVRDLTPLLNSDNNPNAWQHQADQMNLGPHAMDLYASMKRDKNSVSRDTWAAMRGGGLVSVAQAPGSRRAGAAASARGSVDPEIYIPYRDNAANSMVTNLPQEVLEEMSSPETESFIRSAFDAGDRESGQVLLNEAFATARPREGESPRDAVNRMKTSLANAGTAVDVATQAAGAGKDNWLFRASMAKLYPTVTSMFPDGDAGPHTLAVNAIFNSIGARYQSGVRANRIYGKDTMERIARIETARRTNTFEDLSPEDRKVGSAVDRMENVSDNISISKTGGLTAAQSSATLGAETLVQTPEGVKKGFAPRNALLWKRSIDQVMKESTHDVLQGEDPLTAILGNSKELSKSLMASGGGDVKQEGADNLSKLMLAYVYGNNGGDLSTLETDALNSETTLKAVADAQRAAALKTSQEAGTSPEGFAAARARVKTEGGIQDLGFVDSIAELPRNASPSDIAETVGKRSLSYVKGLVDRGSEVYNQLETATKPTLADPKFLDKVSEVMVSEAKRTGRRLSTRFTDEEWATVSRELVGELASRISDRIPSSAPTMTYAESRDKREDTVDNTVSLLGPGVADLGELGGLKIATRAFRISPDEGVSLRGPSSAAVEVARGLRRGIMTEMAGDSPDFLKQAGVTAPEEGVFGKKGFSLGRAALLTTGAAMLGPIPAAAVGGYRLARRAITGRFKAEGLRALDYATRFGGSDGDPVEESGANAEAIDSTSPLGPGSAQRTVATPDSAWKRRLLSEGVQLDKAADTLAILRGRQRKIPVAEQAEKIVYEDLGAMVKDAGLQSTVAMDLQRDVISRQEQGKLTDPNSILQYILPKIENMRKEALVVAEEKKRAYARFSRNELKAERDAAEWGG